MTAEEASSSTQEKLKLNKDIIDVVYEEDPI
jgi:hypothetical protein